MQSFLKDLRSQTYISKKENLQICPLCSNGYRDVGKHISNKHKIQVYELFIYFKRRLIHLEGFN